MKSERRRKILLHNIVIESSQYPGRHLEINKILEIVSESGLLYANLNELYNDLDILSSQNLITSVKANNAGYIMITIKPNAILAVEKQEEYEQERLSVFSRLKFLFDNRDEILKDGPNSEAGINWFVEITSLLEFVDPVLASDFRSNTQYITIPLSNYIIDPLWNQLLHIIKEALFRLGKEHNMKEHIYSAGSQYDLYKDIRKLLMEAKISVFIVEPYPDENIFDLYLDNIAKKVKIRLLVKNISNKFLKVLNMYKNKPDLLLETRHSKKIHDRVLIIDNNDSRVLGQSLKDAAKSKPTYIAPIESIKMIKLYEDIWQTSDIIKYD